MKKIGIIGLGYVGLPLAVEFGKTRDVVGFDIKSDRVKELQSGVDLTRECTQEQLSQAKNLSFTDQISDLSTCEIFIVTVPTPTDNVNRPDMSALISASKLVGSILKKNDLVIFESTVFGSNR